jgi:hypothetical protein
MTSSCSLCFPHLLNFWTKWSIFTKFIWTFAIRGNPNLVHFNFPQSVITTCKQDALLLRWVRLSLWNCTSNGPFVHPPYDTWVNMEQRWNDIDREKQGLGEKPVPVPLCPPQIPYALPWDRTRSSVATNRLCYGKLTDHLQPWRWRYYVPPKCWYLPTSPHGITSQKINIDIMYLAFSTFTCRPTY